MQTQQPPRRTPLVPRLFLGGLLVLLLSWLFFMVEYVLRELRRPRSEAPPQHAPLTSTNALNQRP